MVGVMGAKVANLEVIPVNTYLLVNSHFTKYVFAYRKQAYN
jgi:hypothetical protein